MRTTFCSVLSQVWEYHIYTVPYLDPHSSFSALRVLGLFTTTALLFSAFIYYSTIMPGSKKGEEPHKRSNKPEKCKKSTSIEETTPDLVLEETRGGAVEKGPLNHMSISSTPRGDTRGVDVDSESRYDTRTGIQTSSKPVADTATVTPLLIDGRTSGRDSSAVAKTFGSPDPESVQVKLELGHRATFRKKATADGFTHDWLVFVRGPEGSNIQNFVEKVVFHLHESFPKPKRVVKDPPYQVSESGYAGFTLPIEIYFKNKEEPKKIKFSYDLFLHLDGSPPVNHIRCEKLTFQNPTEEFRRKLLKAGGVGVPGPNEHNSAGSLQPPTTKSTPTPPAANITAPQTPESQVFADLFGAPLKADTHRKHKSHSASKDKSNKPKSGGSANSTPSHTGSVGTPTGPPPPFPITPSKDQHKAPSIGNQGPQLPTLHPTIASKDKSASLAREKERDREKLSKDREREREKEKSSQKRSAETSPSPSDNSKKKRKESSRGEDGKREKEEGKEDRKEGKSRDKDRERDKSKSRSKDKDRDSKSSHKSKKDREKDGEHRSRHEREKDKNKEKDKSESNNVKTHVSVPIGISVTKSTEQVKGAGSASTSVAKPVAEPAKPPKLPKEVVELPPFADELSTGELSDFGFDDSEDLGNKSPLSSLSPSSIKGSSGVLSSLMAEINEFDDDEDMLSPLHDNSPPALFSQNNVRPRSTTPQSDKGSQPPKLDAAHESPSPQKSKKRDKKKEDRKSKEHKENKEKISKESKENRDSAAKDFDKEPVKEPSPIMIATPPIPVETKDMGTNLQDSDRENKMDGVETVVDINGQNKAPNGEYFSVLLQLQQQLMTITDRDLLKRVVNVIEETGLYKISDATFDFDLCCLDTNTVRRIQTCLQLTS